MTEINFGNGLRTTYGYYGTGGAYDTTGGYYGRLWEITTEPQGGGTALMDVRHAWDAGGNLATRQDVLTSETETFDYDALDRLISVSGAYSASYEYDEIGNMMSRNGVSYSYDSNQPHAVDSVGTMSYEYDLNGNMDVRDGQTIEWDAENRPVKITENSTVIATYVYDGDGNRIQKTEAGETILYINSYYEENLTTGNITTSYYLGSRLIAQKEGDELRYMHQDHLSGTSVVTSDNGTLISSIKYYPYGGTRSGDVPTDIQFTGQRLDGTGLYYYGARYYDPVTGRFISADTIIPNPADPQCFNRYSYCLNNPLKYVDPSGHIVLLNGYDVRFLDMLMTTLSSGMMLSLVIDNSELTETLSLYHAWDQYRNLPHETHQFMAKQLEDDEDHIVYIDAAIPENPMKDADTVKKGDDYYISFNPGCTTTADQQGVLIKNQVTESILVADCPTDWGMVALSALPWGKISPFLGRVSDFMMVAGGADRMFQGEDAMEVIVEIGIQYGLSYANTFVGALYGGWSEALRQQEVYDAIMMGREEGYDYQ